MRGSWEHWHQQDGGFGGNVAQNIAEMKDGAFCIM